MKTLGSLPICDPVRGGPSCLRALLPAQGARRRGTRRAAEQGHSDPRPGDYVSGDRFKLTQGGNVVVQRDVRFHANPARPSPLAGSKHRATNHLDRPGLEPNSRCGLIAWAPEGPARLGFAV